MFAISSMFCFFTLFSHLVHSHFPLFLLSFWEVKTVHSCRSNETKTIIILKGRINAMLNSKYYYSWYGVKDYYLILFLFIDLLNSYSLVLIRNRAHTSVCDYVVCGSGYSSSYNSLAVKWGYNKKKYSYKFFFNWEILEISFVAHLQNFVHIH